VTIPDVADWFAERNAMKGRAGIAGSFRLDAHELDHSGLFVGFGEGELAEVSAMSRN